MMKTSKTGIAMVVAMVGSLVLTTGCMHLSGEEAGKVVSPPAPRVRSAVLTLGDYNYVTNAVGHATITGFNKAYSGALSVTNALGGCPVTDIGWQAFSGCANLTSVTIPNSVTRIGIGAFSKCAKLESIRIPSAVVSIDQRAFEGCICLTNIVIPNAVATIGSSAFLDCSNLASITISSAVKTIDSGTFENCVCLTNISIPDGIASIETGAFRGCSNLTSVTIPNSVTNIGFSAFAGCTSLINVVIPDSVTSMGWEAFRKCSGLTNITIPSSVKRIGFSTFRDCTSLKSVTISGGIGYNDGTFAFRHCTSLGRVVIGSNVTRIGHEMFSDCTQLTNVVIANTVTNIGPGAFAGCASLANIVIPASVTSMDRVFPRCASLTAIDVDAANPKYSSVDGVLYDKNQTTLIACPGGKARKLAIPAGVISMVPLAFADCSKLGSIWIPGSVTGLEYCVTSCIRDYGFTRCLGLTAIDVDAANPKYSSIDGVLFDKNHSALLSCPQGKAGGYTIPSGVTRIAWSAFFSCARLTDVTIPSGVTDIASYAFADCTSLTNVTIPASVTNIEYGAFQNCSNLPASFSGSLVLTAGGARSGMAEQVISAPVTSSAPRVRPEILTLGDYKYRTNAVGQATITGFNKGYSGPLIITNALGGCPVTDIWGFGDCSNLTSVTIPASVTNVEPQALAYCPSLTAIMVDIGNPAYSSVDGVLFNKNQTTLIQFPGSRAGHYTIPASVNSIEKQAFEACSRLAGVTIPASVISIGSYAAENVFEACDSLKAITVAEDNSIYTSVDGVLFDKAMNTLICFPGGRVGHYAVPTNVYAIKNSAFVFCRGLDSVTIPSSVINIGKKAFYECTGLTNITIPAGVNIEQGVFENCTSLPASVRALSLTQQEYYQACHQRVLTPQKPPPVSEYTEAEAQKHLEQYQKELIQAGGEKGPPLPMPVTPEMDAPLVKEGVLPPVANEGEKSETSNQDIPFGK